jgi:hypothetical protein
LAIESHELLPLFVCCCPELRVALIRAADDWLCEDGTISYFAVASILRDHTVASLVSGDYGFSGELFLLVERLLGDGSNEVRSVIATGLLEGLANQRRLPAELWVPLIGPRAREYLRAWDRFTAAVTPGLADASRPSDSSGSSERIV